MSKVALVIPARMGSTRLARKALADIEGQPMVVRVAEQARKVKGVTRVVVATDSEEILRAVEKAGFEARINSREPDERYRASRLRGETLKRTHRDQPPGR